jgi:hypothetical protein
MKEEILKFIEDGINIRKTNEGYEVFTIKTQHFKISSLNDLTEERFNKAINDLKERNDLELEIFRLVFNESKQ